MQFGSVRSVRKVFLAKERGGGAQEDLVALDDASFDFEAGEFVSLLGPSGCGKTTLLRMVAGLTPRSGGSITINGKDVDGPYGDYGFVFQAPSLMPWRTVLQNVLFPMDVLKRNDSAAQGRARELLALVGLSDFASSRPHQLSGGMQQRVALCRALIHAPKLLLMDEPFGALDALTREQLMIELARLWQSTSKTVLFITHSIQEALFLGDRVIVMSKRPGEVIKDIKVDIARPRKMSESILKFSTYTSEVRGLLGIQD